MQDIWDLDLPSRERLLERYHRIANQAVKRGRFPAAVSAYKEALYCLRIDASSLFDDPKKAKDNGSQSIHVIRAKNVTPVDRLESHFVEKYKALHNNLSVCYYRQKNYQEARKTANLVLYLEPENRKALVYNCRCAPSIGTAEDSIEKLQALAKKDKEEGREVDTDIDRCCREMQKWVDDQEAREQALFSKMFAAKKAKKAAAAA